VSPGRGIYTDKVPQEYSRDKDVDAGIEDLTASELARWLGDFDNKLDRSIVLVLDRSTWSLLQPNPEDHGEQDSLTELSARLKNIVIVNVPATHDAFHPMASGLGREFKLLYLCFLLGLDVDADRRAAYREEISFVDQLRFIELAWFSVRESIINRSFESVERSLREWAQQHQVFLEPSIQNKNSKALLLSRSMATDGDLRRRPLPHDRTNFMDKDLSREIKSAFPGAPKTVIQYYTAQEAEVGPSSFVRSKVQEMQYHKDFEGCFISDCGQVRFRAVCTAQPIHGKAQLDGGDNATGMDIDVILALDIHSWRNFAPYFSESFDSSQSNLKSQGFAQMGNTVVDEEMIHHNLSSTDSEQQVSSTVGREHSSTTLPEYSECADAALDMSYYLEVRCKMSTKKPRVLKCENMCTG